MNRRDRAFNRHTNAPAPPRLDADRLVRRPLGWLTPNHVVAACRVFLAILAMVALIAGPDGLGSIVLRFAVAYGVTILAMPAFPRVSGSILGGKGAEGGQGFIAPGEPAGFVVDAVAQSDVLEARR